MSIAHFSSNSKCPPTLPTRGRVRRGTVAIIIALLPYSVLAQERTPVEAVEVTAKPVTHFKIGSSDKSFGSLEFVGGLELTSGNNDFGALSAFRFTDAGDKFVGVTDTGFWFNGVITRTDSAPSGVTNFRMTRMTDRNGKPVSRKWNVDAEGLGVRDGVAAVGFERDHRIVEYRLQPDSGATMLRDVDFLVPLRELRKNRGFETVAYSPKDGPNAGALVVVSEKSLDKDGNIFAAVLSGPRKGIFTIKRNDPFDITDGAFLPNGDLLLLERSYARMRGVGLQLRRIPAEQIAAERIADGAILLQANMAYQIDNMEAMDVWTHGDGMTMVSLMSDNNHSMLQRNLYLEFALHED